MSASQSVNVQTIFRRTDPDGNKDRPISYLKAYTGLIYSKGSGISGMQIAASSSSAITLWDRSSATDPFQPSATNGFDYAFFEVDNPLWIEFTVTTGAGTLASSSVCWAQKITSQQPLVVGPAAYISVTNGASASAFSGTAGIITRIRCWEANGNTVNLIWEIRSST